jgi:hypothetical protein
MLKVYLRTAPKRKNDPLKIVCVRWLGRSTPDHDLGSFAMTPVHDRGSLNYRGQGRDPHHDLGDDPWHKTLSN